MTKTRTAKGAISVMKPDPSSSGSDNESEQEVYDVETIRTWRYNRETKTREYWIKWRDWPESTNTWEPEDHLSCPDKMQSFIKKLPKKQRKLHNAPDLDDLSGLQRNADIHCIFTAKSNEDSSFDTTNTSSSSAGAGTSTKSQPKPKFVLMIVFEDSKDDAEEVTLTELFEHRPEKAFEWIEQRFLYQSALEERPDLAFETPRNQMVNSC